MIPDSAIRHAVRLQRKRRRDEGVKNFVAVCCLIFGLAILLSLFRS